MDNGSSEIAPSPYKEASQLTVQCIVFLCITHAPFAVHIRMYSTVYGLKITRMRDVYSMDVRFVDTGAECVMCKH